MDSKSLGAKVEVALGQGMTIGGSSSYFVPAESWDEGEYVILKTEDDAIKFEPSSKSSNLVTYYKVRDAKGADRWVSKNTLFGRHFVAAAGRYKISEMSCRTSMKNVSYHIEDFVFGGKKLSIFVFDGDTKFTCAFSKAPVYLADQDGWDPASKTMSCKTSKENYPLFTLGE